MVAVIAVALLAVGVFAFTLYPMFADMGQREALRTEGVEAPATILAATQTRSRFNEDWVFDIELEVRPQGQKPYWARVSQPLSVLHVPNLHKGGTATVRFDRDDPRSLVIMSTGGAESPAPPSASAKEQPQAQAPDPVCQATVHCCLIAMGQAGRKTCEGFSSPGMTAAACAAALPTYLSMAKKSGASCE